MVGGESKCSSAGWLATRAGWLAGRGGWLEGEAAGCLRLPFAGEID